MSVSSEADPEGGEGSAGVAGVAAQRGGDVDRPRPTELADDQVAQGRHDVWGGAGADLGAVLGEGGVADVVQRLDRPVPPDEVGKSGGAGLGVGEAGDGVDRHGREPPGMVAQVAGLAGDLEDLGGVGEPEMVDRDWSASDFAIENRVWIRQHPLGLLTRGGGSDHDRARAWQRSAGPAGQPVRGRPLDDHAAAHGRQGRRPGGPGRLQARRAGRQAGSGTGGGPGRGGPAGRGAQGAGRPAAVGGGKRALGLSGRVPPRVDAATKSGLLDLLEQACGQGWTVRGACQVLQVSELRVYRWLGRRAAGELEDQAPGGSPMHGLLDWEVAEIIGLFAEWGEVDRSHRKLAHRGSYLERVWVSPASVRRVLARQGLRLRSLPRPGRSVRKPFPDWVEYAPNSIWIYDTTHFTRAGVAATVVEDLVSRKWLAEVVSVEETSTQVQVVVTDALEREGLLELIGARQDGLVDPTMDDPSRPVLLALSDNGPQMTSGSTREFMALCAIHQHFGRPGTPTDQAWIESLFGHVKAEWPHLNAIRDPAMLRAELAQVRERYNGVRLHAGIGYVTPNDEHQGRGPAIRKARQAGLEQARRQRLAWHREHRQSEPPQEPGDVG